MSERTWRAYQTWAQTYDVDPNPQIVLEEETVFREVNCAPGLRILDAGCGTGRYSGQFQIHGSDVVGLDFSPAMLRRARARFPSIPLVEADLAEPLPFGNGCFDRVNCAQTLKHLPSLGSPIAEFERVLKPGGHLVFSVTHPAMTWDGYEMRETPAFLLSVEAGIHHQLADYEAAIAKAGLRLERIDSVRVDEAIRSLLTPESYEAVCGRTQVAVFRASKPTSAGATAASAKWTGVGRATTRKTHQVTG